MVLKGYKRPLVQEDMWELSETDSTADINQRFQYFMQSELGAARVRFKNKLKKKQDKNRDKAHQEAFPNGPSNGLGKGISQDVLMMVREKHLCRLQYIYSVALQMDLISVHAPTIRYLRFVVVE